MKMGTRIAAIIGIVCGAELVVAVVVGGAGLTAIVGWNGIVVAVIAASLLAAVVSRRVDATNYHVEAGTQPPPRPDEVLTTELQERLADNDELAESFPKVTRGRQREYNLHISAAKQPETRNRRIDKVVPRILKGKGLRDR